MGASIHWERNDKKPPLLPIDAPSSFIDVMTNAFGPSPWVLDKESFPVFRGIMASTGTNTEGFNEIIDHINEFGQIRIWPEW